MKLNSHLNSVFAIAAVIVWNALLGVAIWLNGGLGKLKNPSALALSALACGSLAFFAFGAVVSPRIRGIVLKPAAPMTEVRGDLLLLGFIAGFLFIGCLVGLYGAEL